MADDKETHIDGERARAGATPHMTRVILPVSLVLVIIVFVALTYLR
ncbi:hypothetical protein ACX0GZ_07490 [Sphingomonas aestuarii]|jgi:hypothetical protein